MLLIHLSLRGGVRQISSSLGASLVLAVGAGWGLIENMTDGMAEPKRVKFYGAGDFASYWQFDRIAEVIAQFDPTEAALTVVDAIELYNVSLYIEAGLLPVDYSESQCEAAKSLAPRLRASAFKFFLTINGTNLATQLNGIPHYYRSNLLELLSRNKTFERADAQVMLPALMGAGISLGEMLGNKQLSAAYDSHIRGALIADARHAEHLVRKYLQKDASTEIHLPRSFTASDARKLFAAYLEDPQANLNYVRLISTAPIEPHTGIDARLKLEAKRQVERMVAELFKEESTMKFKTGASVSLSDSQDEPAKMELDDMVPTYTYSQNWLDETLDNPSILNNFQHLFEFADDHALLTLPSYPSELGTFERLVTTTGRKHYQTGAAFTAKDISSMLQTHMYRNYLSSKDIDLESVIAWFCDAYLTEEFGVINFAFTPSAPASSYLEKARHLFAEMEGLANQFRHYVQYGEVDRELLAITSDPVAYKQIPSLLDGKYVYPANNEDIRGVLHALFSDQSGLIYINDALQDSSAARLLVQNDVSYSDFLEHQRAIVDELIAFGVLEDTGAHVRITKPQQFLLLQRLFHKEVATYHHLSVDGRAHVAALEARGLLTRRSSLLTEAESSYFNYFLNKAEFSNGPELRNKYLHGSQPTTASEAEHLQTYLTALKLLVALVIKINDEFYLQATDKVSS